MVPGIKRVINVSTDEVYGEGSFGAIEGKTKLHAAAVGLHLLSYHCCDRIELCSVRTIIF